MIDAILKNLEEMVIKKLPLSPTFWVEKAQELAVLVGNEEDRLFGLQKKIAIYKSEQIAIGKSVAQAKVMAEATDDYEEMQKLKAKIERTYEIIRIAKIQSRMRSEEYNSQF